MVLIYLQSSATLPQTILDPLTTNPDDWNSVLFIQKTLNDYNIQTVKSQLPNTPINITPSGSIPNTEMYDTPNFVSLSHGPSKYGFFIIKPSNTTFDIEIKAYTESNPPTSFGGTSFCNFIQRRYYVSRWYYKSKIHLTRMWLWCY